MASSSSEIISMESLSQLNDCANDQYRLQLLRFFAGHPNARYSELAVVHALNINPSKTLIRKALRQLVEQGVIRMSTDINTPFYSLTDNESIRGLVSKVAQADWHQWQSIMNHLLTLRNNGAVLHPNSKGAV